MLTLLLLIAAQPGAAVPASAQGDLAITIYNDNLALVQDVRQIAIPAGRTRIEFPDVSAQIRPETVSLGGDGIGIVEQNFDYDLLSPGKLMEKAVGKTVTIVRTNPANGTETREQALVLATNGGVVLQIGQRIEVLRDDGLPVRVIFDRVPDNLRARPTLSVTLASSRVGPRPVVLSYLTPGLGWRADYVARFDPEAGKVDVQGWITLSNTTGTNFANADLVMVAGTPNRGGRDEYRERARSNIRQAGTESGSRARLGDYYLYPLKDRTTVANAQTKQVSFLDVQGAPAQRAYEYRVDWLQSASEAESADSVIKFSNSASGGLGDQLPAGIVRVYVRDAKGAPQFIGENRIDHTPMGSSLGLKTGEAFDVKVKPVVQKREKILADEWERTARYRITKSDGTVRTVEIESSPTYWRTVMSYTLTNARPNPVTVDLTQAGLDRGSYDTRVPSESVPGEQRSIDERVWRVMVPANGETVVTATFDTRY
jgi:hypothetical protein